MSYDFTIDKLCCNVFLVWMMPNVYERFPICSPISHATAQQLSLDFFVYNAVQDGIPINPDTCPTREHGAHVDN